MGDADHFSRSTDRDILSDPEDRVKCRENEKEVIAPPAQSSNSRPMALSLKAKKTPRAKSSRKNNRRQALVLAEDQSGNVNAAEHEEQFCSCVNLYVDYLLVGAVKELVVDAPLRDKSKKKGSREENKETGMDKVESEPVFTATDDSYMDLICEEIHSTLPCNERFDEEEDDEIENSVRHRDRYVNINVGHVHPPLLSTTEGERNDVFEMKAEEYINTSIPENDFDIDEDDYDTANDVFEDIPSSIQPDVSETTGIHHCHRQHSQSRRKYEFEVDCETGMVFSFEIVEPGEDESGDEYEYEDCDNCDGCDGRNSAEPDNVDGESNICIVEFEPDNDSNVFQVINEDEDIEETVYTVVDEFGTDAKLAKKTSNFRARSPTKLPRAIREGTESHRRRCYSTGDAERFEGLESSSSEFYSHADTIDRFMTLPSPPKSSPGSDGVDNSEGDMSSSQEELSEILDPPDRKYHPLLRDAIEDKTDAFAHDVMITTESKYSVNKEMSSRESLPGSGRRSNQNNEEERRWQVRRVQHQIKLNKLDAGSPHHVGEVSYNTNHRATEGILAVDVGLERCQEMPEHTPSALGGIDSSAFQGMSASNAKGCEEVTDADEDALTRHQLPFDADCLEGVKEVVEQQHDVDENVFEYIRGRRGRLSRREVNELLTDLAREKEAMDRMLRDAHRAQDEYIQLRKGVKKLLKRLESCQPA